MNQVVPWSALVALIAPFARGAHHALGGRPPFPIETMLRIHCLQMWWNLSDPPWRKSCTNGPWTAALQICPTRPPSCAFDLLDKNQLAPQILSTINATLAQQGLMLKRGTIVYATIIAAPSSTKNKDRERDPEMHQTKNGNEW